MTRPLWFYALLLAACGAHFALIGCSEIPVRPIDPPIYKPPVNPTPVEPPIPVPTDPPVAGSGVIDDAKLATVADGDTVGMMLAKLGEPFQKHDAAGFTIYTYVWSGSGKTAAFWVKADLVDHRTVTP